MIISYGDRPLMIIFGAETSIFLAWPWADVQ